MGPCWALQMPPSAKAVLISLADNANDHGVCWPSIPTICERTCLGKTAVISAIKWLEDHSALRIDRSASRSNRYTLTPHLYVQETHPDLLIEAERASRAAQRAAGERSASRTVRETDRPAGEPEQSASRTSTVRQADPNRKEPSGTATQERQRAECAPTDKRGHRLPDDWAPGPDLLAWAAENAPAVDVQTAADEFRDYWRAVPGAKGRKLDWDATFRNRLREVAERRKGHAGSGGNRESVVERVRRKIGDAERGYTHGATIDGEWRLAK